MCVVHVLWIRDWWFSNYSPLKTVKTTVRDRRVTVKKEVVVSTGYGRLENPLIT